MQTFSPAGDDEDSEVRDKYLGKVYNHHEPKGHKSQKQCQLSSIFSHVSEEHLCVQFAQRLRSLDPHAERQYVIRLIIRALNITFNCIIGIPSHDPVIN